MDLAIVIPCANDLRLAQCLSSIDEEVEVIVALNGATNAVRQIVIERGIGFCELPHRNLGAACDMGVRAAKSSSVLLMNSDCIFAHGTIRRLAEALNHALVARGRVVFKAQGLITRISAGARDYTYTRPGKAYQPGIAFRKEIVELIGYYFDPDIHWIEDADFSRRVAAAGIPVVTMLDAVVYHPAVGLWEDLRSAMRYGMGRRVAEEKGLIGTYPPFRLSLRNTLRRFKDIRNNKNYTIALYICIPWTLAFSFGYELQKILHIYKYQIR